MLSSGALSYDDGTDTVTLTGLQWVGDPYSSTLTVQMITLLVTADGGGAAPEPGSLLLIGSGLASLGLLKRRVIRRTSRS